MKKKNRDYILITIIISIIFSLLTIVLWFSLKWISILITLPFTVVIELFLLQWIDKKYVIEEKQKLIQLGLLTSSDTQIITQDTKDEIEQLKNFVRLNITDLNELLASLEEGYREALEKLDAGEIEDAKFQFKSVSKDIVQKFKEIENEVEESFNEFPIPEDRDKKFLFDSYKDNWNSEVQRKKARIKDIVHKFKVRSEFTVHLEDILQFEVENQRPITDFDIKKMKFPYSQAKQLIKFIEKPITLNIEELSLEEKQKYGTLGRKIIENCAKNQVTPNLPYLTVKLGIAIQEAKKILTYLHLVGMIEDIFYHYVKPERKPG
ncbi:MAG: hypothetical protein ACTSYB_10080 [Candidatus Helarchaeota archaeon]